MWIGSLGPRKFWGTRATNFSIYTTKMEGAGPKILGTGAKFKQVPCQKKFRVNRALILNRLRLSLLSKAWGRDVVTMPARKFLNNNGETLFFWACNNERPLQTIVWWKPLVCSLATNGYSIYWPIKSLTRVFEFSTKTKTITWLWRWLPHRISKRQSLTTVPLRTPITQMIFFNQFMWNIKTFFFLLISSLSYFQKWIISYIYLYIFTKILQLGQFTVIALLLVPRT